MRKKILSLFLIVVLILSTGCSSNNIPLTDDELNAIAQYSAYLMMKYDENKNVKEKLLDADDLEELKQEAEEATATPVPSPTPEPTDAPMQQTDPEITEALNQENNDEKQDSPENNPDNKNNSDDSNRVKNITELYNPEFTVTYKKYTLTDHYQENKTFTITAPENKKILALYFNIKNNTGTEKKFSSADENIVYTLINSDNRKASSEISMLSNDLQFLNEKIGPGAEIEAVLIFYVKENDRNFTVQLKDSETGKYFDIEIK